MSIQDNSTRNDSNGSRPRLTRATMNLVKRLGLSYVTPEALTYRRLRHGRGFRYVTSDGRALPVREIKRLTSLAVPPAYQDVLYAADARAHIQAVGRDAAGRVQYRYHPEWEQVRERRKARRLAKLAEALPQIRRSISHNLALAAPSRAFALSAVVELVARSGIRPGSEQYARLRGTRGAVTLLKSNASVYGETVRLRFKAKGGKLIEKDIHEPRLAKAISLLRELPGRRLFQYRADDGVVRSLNAADVNQFLREISGAKITLKDFRTLLASVSVLEALARIEPAASSRGRRRQVLDAICKAAAELGNTPAICRKSYVHEAVVSAFEEGILERFAAQVRPSRTSGEKILAKIARPRPIRRASLTAPNAS